MVDDGSYSVFKKKYENAKKNGSEAVICAENHYQVWVAGTVMEIGDKIIFLVEGKKIWEGNNEEILNTDDKLINDVVYSSELFKKVKLSQKK